MPHHFKDPGVAPADESRELPEQAVTDNTSKTGGTGNPIADTAVQAVNTRKQNPPRKKKKSKRDKEHTRLKSAINRAADKGDADR